MPKKSQQKVRRKKEKKMKMYFVSYKNVVVCYLFLSKPKILLSMDFFQQTYYWTYINLKGGYQIDEIQVPHS